MNAQTQRLIQAGPAGAIEVALDGPASDTPARGVAVICHPHPLHGGTMDNKVVQTLARAFLACGWRTVRFNFRGVGRSEGVWDQGQGEIEDALSVLQGQRHAGEALALAGFSFGGYVASQVALKVSPTAAMTVVPHESRAAGANDDGDALSAVLSALILVGPATRNFTVAPVPPETLVVHGEADDVVPLAATLDWARPQGLPVVVVPGVGHFFHGRLSVLKNLVVRHLRGVVPAGV